MQITKNTNTWRFIPTQIQIGTQQRNQLVNSYATPPSCLHSFACECVKSKRIELCGIKWSQILNIPFYFESIFYLHWNDVRKEFTFLCPEINLNECRRAVACVCLTMYWLMQLYAYKCPSGCMHMWGYAYVCFFHIATKVRCFCIYLNGYANEIP